MVKNIKVEPLTWPHLASCCKNCEKDHRLSQKQLADVIAVTTGTVSNYENNQHLPDIEKLIMLADYFGVTTDYLLGRSISRLPPDIFEEQLVPGKSMSSILNDFRKLSLIGKTQFYLL